MFTPLAIALMWAVTPLLTAMIMMAYDSMVRPARRK